MTEPVSTTPVTVESGSCPACGHPQDGHDELGRRYCAATAAAALDRGCICANRAAGR